MLRFTEGPLFFYRFTTSIFHACHRYVLSDPVAVVNAGVKKALRDAVSFNWQDNLPLALDKIGCDTDEKKTMINAALEQYNIIVRPEGEDATDEEDERALAALDTILQTLVADCDVPKLPEEPLEWKEGASKKRRSGPPSAQREGQGQGQGATQT